ncbi:prolipoprotein diacylglyceryl transferase [bacterium]|nr:prolipoprotein diacylglyceryl transferase [bacterium]
MAIVIQAFSPVALSLGALDVRWYALAYVAAFVVGYWLLRHLVGAGRGASLLNKKQMDDLFTAVVLGVILGGRLGYVLFYNPGFFWTHPWEIFAIWHGGMSFHGGLLGVIAAVFWVAHRARVNPWRILDPIAVVAPIGLFFGRIANFINMEIMGRPTDVAWGVIFDGVSDTARHPSPLYEAATEGLLLFALMYGLWRFTKLRARPGALSGVLGMGYAAVRIFCEQFRAPDAQIGFLTSWGLTMGQLLSAVMFVAGATIFAVAMRKK